ncbi:M15 family metallopeptidase [Nocardioides sp. IC4_145]|uniref:M15 family metallopeptidase n=1 Tax=Nocardioides sp. IC4_145 TaxID=2714037 RepID=UPI001407D5D5|nr:M15 family metallopeptidase [Nocardioides sp. IC4_145]NHC23743.1 M15 family metallopeptidase [Nocardioides sp. IC4_145]
MTILLADPRVRAVPVIESGEPLVRLGADLSPAGAVVRAGLAERLVRADAALPTGLRLRVLEGHRSAADQQAIIETYAAQLCALHPGIGPADLERLTSRFVAPLDVAPHVAGAAVDLTLVDVSVDPAGVELDLGTPIDATPEQSGGRCFTAADDIPAAARARRDLLAEVLGAEGLVNYPTEWWHWSHGDRYWALVTGADHALHGPVLVEAEVAA